MVIFYKIFSSSKNTALNDRMINELSLWKKAVVAHLSHYKGVCLQKPRKSTRKPELG
jgi:hypothetical protein